jgi:phenylpropionate dioxygenase-like ring-hydroxylating dioxygenase large terminal subunit
MTETVARQPVPTRPGRQDWATWPRYEAAVIGFRGYWYPAIKSHDVRRQPVQVELLGEKIMLKREQGRIFALHDRCPHRGVPLSHSMATQEFAGTWSCCYHGWTFDLETGKLVAAITDGPESPIAGKCNVRTYPVEERLGMVWLYLGDDDPPPPVETDIPSELLRADAAVANRRTVREGNWRFGAENGIDEGHAKWLHRRALWTLRRRMPTWTRHHVEDTGEGWLTRVATEVHWDTDFPGLGRWPRGGWWRKKGRGTARVSIRLPCALRVAYPKWTHFEWWVPVDAENHVYVQMVCQSGPRLRRSAFIAFYYLWVRWVFHGMFNDEDALMVDVMDAPPERLYRPDVSITEWRKLCEQQERGVPQPLAAGDR